MPMIRKLLIGLLLAALAFIAVIAFTLINPFQETIEIAVVGPLGSKIPTDQTQAQNNVDAINLYLKAVNQAGGIDGKRVVLSVYDDKGDSDVAAQVAEKIVRSKAIVLLGHTSSRLTLAGSKAYEKYQMPVISGSATADKLGDFDWFFRTVFSNRDQGILMANYVKKILEIPKINLVYSDDAYGTNLGATISETFQALGGEVSSKWILGKQPAAEIQRMTTSLKSAIEAGKEPGALVVAIPFEQAAEFIHQVKLANLNLPILGGDALADLGIAQYFAKDPKEKENKGFFTNGIQAINPVIFDVLDDSGQQFRTDFEQTYGRDPGWIAACFQDGAIAVVKVLKESNIRRKTVSDLRKLVIAELKKINTPETAFEGAGRLIYFDDRGNALTPAYISRYDRQQLISAFNQLQLIRNPALVTDLKKKIERDEILKIGDRYLQKTSIVYVGMDINELTNINQETSTYLLDFYLWFRYRGDIPADNIEFTNYSTEGLNAGDKLRLGEPIEKGKEDGINYRIYRMKAAFNEVFNFRLYPFDRQILKVRFRHANLTRDQLIYVVDLVGMRGAKSDRILEQAERTGVFRGITSWIIEQVQFFQNTLLNNSTFGNRQLIDTDSDIRYSQFNANIHVKRDVVSFSVKNLLPLLFFIIVSYLLMFLPLDKISIEAVSGLLLAVVFYHLNLTARLPNSVGYTVLLDYAFYIVYALLGLQLLMIVVGNSARFKSYGLQPSRLMWFGRIAFPSIIGISTACLFWVVLGKNAG